jgi:hypothetical protein
MQPIVVADRDIAADDEYVIAQPIAGVVIVSAFDVVMKGPGAPWLLDDVTDSVRFPWPKPDHTAGRAITPPGFCVDPVVLVERKNEYIAIGGASFGMCLFACELEPDTLELVRKMGFGPVCLFGCRGHVGVPDMP